MAFHLGDGALDVPSITIDAVVEAGKHLATVFGFGQLVLEAAWIERDHRGANTEFFPADFVSVLGIIALVGEKPVEGDVFSRLTHGRFQEGYIVAWATRDHSAGKQIGLGMANHRDFGPMPLREGLPLAASIEVVRTGMARFQPSGVNSPFGPLVYETEGVSPLENGGEQGGQSPFFKSRLSA